MRPASGRGGAGGAGAGPGLSGGGTPPPAPAPAVRRLSVVPPRAVRSDRRLPEQDTDIPLPNIPSPRLGGAPRDRAEHRAEIHRRFELLAECEPDSVHHRALRDELIAEHMNYARYVASRFSVPADTAEDLEQVAYLALVKAVDNFDPDHGTAFLGYATPMITGEIKRYFRDSTWDVHVPRRMQELSLALHSAPPRSWSPSWAARRRSPSWPSTSARRRRRSSRPWTPRPPTRRLAGRAAGARRRAGRQPGRGSAGTTTRFEWVVDREALKPLLAELRERDKRILLMRFFRGMTQARSATELGVSQMQVSRYLTRILDPAGGGPRRGRRGGVGGERREVTQDSGCRRLKVISL